MKYICWITKSKTNGFYTKHGSLIRLKFNNMMTFSTELATFEDNFSDFYLKKIYRSLKKKYADYLLEE